MSSSSTASSRESDQGPPALDHLIFLVPDIEEATSYWTSLGFTVTPGGTHADGLTSNILIILQDGVYLELIAFEEGPAKGSEESVQSFLQRQKEHWWYGKKQGSWIDWCLAGGISDDRVSNINVWASDTTEMVIIDGSNDHLPKGGYLDYLEGGRTTPAGDKIQWKVTFPHIEPAAMDEKPEIAAAAFTARGQLPFWCEDVTDRSLRVPSGPSHDSHSNSAASIKTLTLLFKAECMEKVKDAYEIILQPPASTSAHPDGDLSFPLAAAASPSDQSIMVRVKIARTETEKRFLEKNGEGLYQVELRTTAGGSILLPLQDTSQDSQQEPQESSQEAPREGAVTGSRKRKSEA